MERAPAEVAREQAAAGLTRRRGVHAYRSVVGGIVAQIARGAGHGEGGSKAVPALAQAPKALLIAPDACRITTWAAVTSPVSAARVTERAKTSVTSPASQRAMSRSWIIWSRMMPPASAG